MTCLQHLDAAEAPIDAAAWSDLVRELDCWAAAGRAAVLWWRDDDAVEPSAPLERLLSLAGAAPIGLAVIPALARPALANVLARAPQVAILQHGWRHTNRAALGKKSEFPAGRPGHEVADELATGRARLAALFGARALPVFVPPWNRFAAEFQPLLAKAGIAALSSMAPRRGPLLPPGIASIDVHADLVAWRIDRGFVGTEATLGQILAQLRARRFGMADAAAPTGILTHHSIMDDPTARFLEDFCQLVHTHRAVRWAAPAELLQ